MIAHAACKDDLFNEEFRSPSAAQLRSSFFLLVLETAASGRHQFPFGTVAQTTTERGELDLNPFRTAVPFWGKNRSNFE